MAQTNTTIRTIAIHDPGGIGPAWIDEDVGFLEAKVETYLIQSESLDEILARDELAVLVVLAEDAQLVRRVLERAKAQLRRRQVSFVVYGSWQCLAELGSDNVVLHPLAKLTPIALATTVCSALWRHGEQSGWHKTVDILSGVNQFDQRLSGETFMHVMVEYLARALDLPFVFVGTVTRPELGQLEAQAVWHDGGHAEGFLCQLASTPCCHVFSENRVTICSQGVRGLYPDDVLAADLCAESSMAAPIVGTNGEVYGALVAYDTKPRLDVDVLGAVLEFFAGRTGVELDRQRAAEDRRKASNNLEELVAKRTHEVSSVHGQMVEFAYQTGMTELAVDIIDRVSNVLNTIQVSAGRIEQLQHGRLVELLAKANSLLAANKENLATFLEVDERGKKLIDIFRLVEDRLRTRESSLSAEVHCILESTDVMERVISCRTHICGDEPILEQVPLSPLVRDAVQLQTSALEADGVYVQLQLAELPLISAYRHQVVQTVVSLLKVARHSLINRPLSSRKICVETGRSDQSFAFLRVSDNGAGFIQEDLDAMFRVHSSAEDGMQDLRLYRVASQVRQMGGRIEIENGGEEMGCSFTVTLPLAPSGVVNEMSE